MKYFFLKLENGIDEKNVSKKEKKILIELIAQKFVREEKGIFYLKRKYGIGTLFISSNRTGFVSTSEQSQKDILVESYHLSSASNGDIVIVEKIFKKRGRLSGKVVKILKQENSTKIVYLKRQSSKNNNNRVVAFDFKRDTKVNLEVSQKSLKQLPDLTVLKIDYSTHDILEVVGVLTDPQIDEKLVLTLYNRVENFTKQSEVEARSFGDQVDKTMYPDRVDLTHLDFCTIDPVSAKDFDDAIYFDTKNLTLYVAIADVSEYVYLNSSIDREAFDRGFSIYFPHKSIPMLPRTLSENICSLKPNEDRLAFTIKIKLNSDFYIESSELLNTVINSKKRFNYDEVDNILENRPDLKNFNWLYEINKIAKILRERRLKHGFDFDSEEIDLVLDDKNQNIKKVVTSNFSLSHSLIEECMLLANQESAKRISYGIFRNHEQPSKTKLSELIIKLSQIGILVRETPDVHKLISSIQNESEEIGMKKYVDKMIILSMKQAFYSSENMGHFGLGFENYSHFTSPIRRYSDLTLHRLLKTYVDNSDENIKKRKFILSNIDALNTKISDLERETNRIMWDFNDRKYARYILNNINQQYKVIILDIGKNDITAKITEGVAKGTKVYLEIDSIDILTEALIQITNVSLVTTKIKGKIISVL
jgi:ribonuclease R